MTFIENEVFSMDEYDDLLTNEQFDYLLDECFTFEPAESSIAQSSFILNSDEISTSKEMAIEPLATSSQLINDITTTPISSHSSNSAEPASKDDLSWEELTELFASGDTSVLREEFETFCKQDANAEFNDAGGNPPSTSSTDGFDAFGFPCHSSADQRLINSFMTGVNADSPGSPAESKSIIESAGITEPSNPSIAAKTSPVAALHLNLTTTKSTTTAKPITAEPITVEPITISNTITTSNSITITNQISNPITTPATSEPPSNSPVWQVGANATGVSSSNLPTVHSTPATQEAGPIWNQQSISYEPSTSFGDKLLTTPFGDDPFSTAFGDDPANICFDDTSITTFDDDFFNISSNNNGIDTNGGIPTAIQNAGSSIHVSQPQPESTYSMPPMQSAGPPGNGRQGHHQQVMPSTTTTMPSNNFQNFSNVGQTTYQSSMPAINNSVGRGIIHLSASQAQMTKKQAVQGSTSGVMAAQQKNIPIPNPVTGFQPAFTDEEYTFLMNRRLQNNSANTMHSMPQQQFQSMSTAMSIPTATPMMPQNMIRSQANITPPRQGLNQSYLHMQQPNQHAVPQPNFGYPIPSNATQSQCMGPPTPPSSGHKPAQQKAQHRAQQPPPFPAVSTVALPQPGQKLSSQALARQMIEAQTPVKQGRGKITNKGPTKAALAKAVKSNMTRPAATPAIKIPSPQKVINHAGTASGPRVQKRQQNPTSIKVHSEVGKATPGNPSVYPPGFKTMAIQKMHRMQQQALANSITTQGRHGIRSTANGYTPMANGNNPMANGSNPMAQGNNPVPHGNIPMAYGNYPTAYGNQSMIYGTPMVHGNNHTTQNVGNNNSQANGQFHAQAHHATNGFTDQIPLQATQGVNGTTGASQTLHQIDIAVLVGAMKSALATDRMPLLIAALEKAVVKAQRESFMRANMANGTQNGVPNGMPTSMNSNMDPEMAPTTFYSMAQTAFPSMPPTTSHSTAPTTFPSMAQTAFPSMTPTTFHSMAPTLFPLTAPTMSTRMATTMTPGMAHGMPTAMNFTMASNMGVTMNSAQASTMAPSHGPSHTDAASTGLSAVQMRQIIDLVAEDQPEQASHGENAERMESRVDRVRKGMGKENRKDEKKERKTKRMEIKKKMMSGGGGGVVAAAMEAESFSQLPLPSSGPAVSLHEEEFFHEDIMEFLNMDGTGHEDFFMASPFSTGP